MLKLNFSRKIYAFNEKKTNKLLHFVVGPLPILYLFILRRAKCLSVLGVFYSLSTIKLTQIIIFPRKDPSEIYTFSLISFFFLSLSSFRCIHFHHVSFSFVFLPPRIRMICNQAENERKTRDVLLEFTMLEMLSSDCTVNSIESRQRGETWCVCV